MGKRRNEKISKKMPPFAYSIGRAGFMLGRGKTSVHHLISTGALWTVAVGNRRMIPRSAVEGFIASAR